MPVQISKNLPYASTYISTCEEPDSVNMEFVSWINNVERAVYKVLNMYLEDLPDELYMVSFEEKIPWKKMAKDIVDNSLAVFC